jgi:hypothetical protein
MRSDLGPPEAESIGPESLPAQDEEPLESEAPADAVATHGPAATEIAAADGEVDLDVTPPTVASAHEVPAGLPVEHEESGEGAPAA